MTNQLLARFELLNQLSSVARYSRDHVHRRESVLEHIGFCALYALTLCNRIAALDRKELLVRAVMHDVDEAVMGDAPRTTKYASKELAEAFKVAERKAVMKLSEKIGSLSFNDWEKAKDETLEGQAMKLIDFAAVVQKAWSEICLFGNFSFRRVLLELHKALLEICFSEKYKYHPLIGQEFMELERLVQRMVNGSSDEMRFDLFGEAK